MAPRTRSKDRRSSCHFVKTIASFLELLHSQNSCRTPTFFSFLLQIYLVPSALTHPVFLRVSGRDQDAWYSTCNRRFHREKADVAAGTPVKGWNGAGAAVAVGAVLDAMEVEEDVDVESREVVDATDTAGVVSAGRAAERWASAED